jgi:hypothetical protein
MLVVPVLRADEAAAPGAAGAAGEVVLEAVEGLAGGEEIRKSAEMRAQPTSRLRTAPGYSPAVA